MLRVHSPPGRHASAASSTSTTVGCAVSPQRASPRSRSPRKAQGAVIDLAPWRQVPEREIHTTLKFNSEFPLKNYGWKATFL